MSVDNLEELLGRMRAAAARAVDTSLPTSVRDAAEVEFHSLDRQFTEEGERLDHEHDETERLLQQTTDKVRTLRNQLDEM